MPRETKQERLAREQLERQMQQAAEASEYPMKLMEVLERAVKANFELTVKDQLFVVRDRDESWNEPVTLSLTYSTVDRDNLEQLERDVAYKEAEAAEESRKFAVRSAALAKLNQEERELLGLK